MSNEWTKVEDDMLREFAKQRLSASQISILLNTGRSRNAVIGRVNRLNIEFTGLSKRAKSKPTLKKVYTRQVKKVYTRQVSVSVITTPEEVTSDSVTLLELKDNMCRWPVGEMFCSAPTITRRSYCAKHTTASHQIAQPYAGRRLNRWYGR